MAMSYSFILGLANWLVLVGLFLVYRGARGTPTLCDPKCAKCGYDLRWVDPNVNVRCPECGSDLKAKRAVRFGDYRRRPRLIVLGSLVLLMGLLIPTATAFLVRPRARPAAMPATTPTSTLIANLATTAYRPEDWQELEARWRAGRLSKAEAAAAIDQLINHVKTRPGGWVGPLFGCEKFFALADQGGAVSDEQLGRLGVAFYGPQPCISARARVRQGKFLLFEIASGNPWNLPGLRLVRALRSLTLDGTQPLTVYFPHARTPSSMPADAISGDGYWPIGGKVLMDVPKGKHKLQFDVDMGLLPIADPSDAPDGPPGQANRWPRPRCKWSQTGTVAVEVVAADASAVEVITEDAVDPAKNGVLAVSATAQWRSEEKSVLRLSFEAKGLAVPIVAVVSMSINGLGRPVGSLEMPAGSSRRGLRSEIPRPSPAIRTIDVVLIPAVEVAEEATMFDRVWGREIVLKDVPLRREDLGDAEDNLASNPTRPSAASRPGTRE